MVHQMSGSELDYCAAVRRRRRRRSRLDDEASRQLVFPLSPPTTLHYEPQPLASNRTIRLNTYTSRQVSCRFSAFPVSATASSPTRDLPTTSATIEHGARARHPPHPKTKPLSKTTTGRRGVERLRPKRVDLLGGSWRPKSVPVLCWAATLFLLLAIGSSTQLISAKSIEDTSKSSDYLSPQQHLDAKIDPAKKTTVEEPAKESTPSPATLEPEVDTTTTTAVAEGEEDDASARDDDSDAEICSGVHCGERTAAKNLTDNDRLVELQAYLKRKMKASILGASRYGMDVFSTLSLSGGCMNSILSLTSSLSEIKSYAVKFVDASAKIPSGVMYGLLSDFGDFDECMSIRSNKRVAPEDEESEGEFSAVPDGIDEDGVIWDDLLRTYWTTNSSKGFQVGVCLPSRCTNDDIEQLYKYVAKSYNAVGELMSCQDRSDLSRQTTPDVVQRIILALFGALIGLCIAGSLFERYLFDRYTDSLNNSHCLLFMLKLLASFSVIRNWRLFMESNRHLDLTTIRSSTLSRCSNYNNNNNNEALTQLHKINSFMSRSSREESDSTSVVDSTSVDDNHSSKDRFDQSTTTETSNKDLLTTTKFQNICEDTTGKPNDIAKPLTVQVQPIDYYQPTTTRRLRGRQYSCRLEDGRQSRLKFLSGLRLFVILWITIGHSFLYPSAHNYQYYRSIINLSVTRNSVWFATTNFTLGIDMILYMTGLVLVYKLAKYNTMRTQSNTPGNKEHPFDRYVSSKLVIGSNNNTIIGGQTKHKLNLSGAQLINMIVRKILRFWPTYLTVIALAIVIPLCSDGPMWPEMVSKRIGSSCRQNWWTNLLMINNFYSEAELCLPSSWFISVLMQLFLFGSLVVAIIGRLSFRMAVTTLTLLTIASSCVSFWLASLMEVRAPVIKMDETFVLEMDEKVFKLYTNIFNNIGPFLVGMIGGLILIEAENEKRKFWGSITESIEKRTSNCSKVIRDVVFQALIAIIVICITVAVLSSTFIDLFTPFWASTYWALHRIGWAIFTGYFVHNCAMGRWKLIRDFLSLSTFQPISKLVFVAYLIYPILIHVHSGLVRDGLHVSIYNMMNIYITRLVMTFSMALAIHLLVELPFNSIEEVWRQYRTERNLEKCLKERESAETGAISMDDKNKPLLKVVAAND